MWGEHLPDSPMGSDLVFRILEGNQRRFWGEHHGPHSGWFASPFNVSKEKYFKVLFFHRKSLAYPKAEAPDLAMLYFFPCSCLRKAPRPGEGQVALCPFAKSCTSSWFTPALMRYHPSQLAQEFVHPRNMVLYPHHQDVALLNGAHPVCSCRSEQWTLPEIWLGLVPASCPMGFVTLPRDPTLGKRGHEFYPSEPDDPLPIRYTVSAGSNGAWRWAFPSGFLFKTTTSMDQISSLLRLGRMTPCGFWKKHLLIGVHISDAHPLAWQLFIVSAAVSLAKPACEIRLGRHARSPRSCREGQLELRTLWQAWHGT